MVTSALLGGSPSPTAPVPFLKSMKYFPTPENHIIFVNISNVSNYTLELVTRMLRK